MFKKIILFFILVSIILGIGFAFSNKPYKQDIPKPEQHKVTVRLVLVDVIALDKDSKFVKDLTRDDFEIWDEGKKVAINSLDLISYQVVETLKEKLPEKEEAKEQTPVIPRKSKFFVVFDSINTIKRMLDRRKPELLETLNSLIGIGHEIMILELTDKEGTKVLQNLTSDKQLIAQAVQKASGSIWIEKASDTLSIPNIIMVEGATNPSVLRSYKKTAQEQYQYETRIRFEKTISNLLSVMNIIKDYPGRKPVLFISGGFPALSFGRIYDAPKQSSSGIEQSAPVQAEIEAAKVMDPFKVLQKTKRRYGSDIFADFINFANSFNISFYTLDPDDYLRYVLPDISYDNYPRVVGMGESNRISYEDGVVFYRDENAEIKKSELSNLKYMAVDTGGEALQGGNKFQEFRETISRDLSYYYELSFYPRKKEADEKYHDIKVRVKRPGVEVSHRKGYFDYSKDQKESLLFASTSYNPGMFKDISFQARAVPFISGKNEFILWLNLALPVKDLILSGDPYEGLKIIKTHFWVDDPQGAQAFKAQLNIPINLTESFRERLSRARFFGYNTRSNELILKENQYRVIFTLYDEESDRVGTVEQNMKVPVLDTLTEGDIATAVFGHMIDTGKKDKMFSISMEDGSLSVDTYRFHPMGTEEFNSKRDVFLLLQVYSNEDRDNLVPEFELYQYEEVPGKPESVLIKESWNKKAKVKNLLFKMNFHVFNRGDYTLTIKMIDEDSIEKTQRKLKIKLL